MGFNSGFKGLKVQVLHSLWQCSNLDGMS